ncbi:MarR family transcriptional regulator [Enterococcus florum]|uniref:MarR family transcriptional regulator n=1 Tax=Enterococcus florum TaxID=2480627 RepID=A0A4P5P831_9ENTE|nr:MarR family winged helix-turn-helix transcriptional regulator [Enterococcus florum]GCF94165.1 MarR family transcriptional regulator [Enterococcus florum]
MDEKQRLFLISQTYATLFSATNKVQTAGDEAIEELTSRQLMAFIAIAHLPEGQATLNRIASKLGASKQSTAQIITNLKRRGYLRTERNTADGRAVNIVITETGKAVFNRSNARGWAFLQELFQGFSNEELEVFWKLLRKLYQYDGTQQDGFEANGREV